MSVFAIRSKDTPDFVLARVEAPNRRAALAYGRNNIEAVELSSKEIVDAVQSGKGIIDIGDETDEAEQQAKQCPPLVTSVHSG